MSVHTDRGNLHTAACEADGVVVKMVLFKDVSERKQAVGSASQMILLLLETDTFQNVVVSLFVSLQFVAHYLFFLLRLNEIT